MDDILRHLVRTNLNLKVTEDLLQIWQQSVTDEYQGEYFEIIGEILLERLGYLPPQSNRTNIHQSINHIESLLEAYKLDEAIRECDSLLQVVPTLAEVYHYRGLAFDEKGRFDKALIDYRKAVQLNPELIDAWDDLKSVEEDIESEFQQSIMKQHLDNALDFAFEGEFENALDEIKLAIPSIPSIAKPYNYLGNIFEEMGKLEEAIVAYRIAIQYNPKYYAARENLVKASYKLEENQYQHISALDIDANIEFDETIQFNLVDEDKPIPGWVYLNYEAYILMGWPGHRTRPGRSGYDPLETEFENAHIQGRIIRMLFTRKFRTLNPFNLMFMSYFGIISFFLPLIFGIPSIINGEWVSLIGIIVIIPYWMIGIALLMNVFLSIRMKLFKECDDEGKAFF